MANGGQNSVELVDAFALVFRLLNGACTSYLHEFMRVFLWLHYKLW